MGNAGPGPSADVDKNKGLAALAYVWIISLVLLLVKKDSPFVQFHAKQGFIIFIASIILGFIPILGWLLNLLLLIFVIIGIVSALQGKWRKLPGVSILAEKINF